jgi:hypothetical protein
MQSRPLYHLLQSHPDTEALLLPDLEAATVRRLLHFLYRGVLRIGKNDIGEFLGLVEQWGISPRVTIVPTTAEASKSPQGDRLAPTDTGSSLPEEASPQVPVLEINLFYASKFLKGAEVG